MYKNNLIKANYSKLEDSKLGVEEVAESRFGSNLYEEKPAIMRAKGGKVWYCCVVLACCCGRGGGGSANLQKEE